MYFVIGELNGKQIFKSEGLSLKESMELLDEKVVTDDNTIGYKYFIEKNGKQSFKFPTMRIVEKMGDENKYYQIEYNSNSVIYKDIEEEFFEDKEDTEMYLPSTLLLFSPEFIEIVD